ncbi:MAG: lactate racemase domain-containing protein [Deltaproteobacteria bacterium]|nr:lactate racemase domain-containing protein [Deltaproteobacteria bacterium]MDL1960652.1 lactate racemase domain-containing protein [Deltaproteobacteria bacterium]
MQAGQENHITTLRPCLDLFAPIDEGLLKKAVSNALECLEKPQALTVVVNDPQRQTDSLRVLKVLSHLIDPACIRILVATGTHRYSSQKMRGFELKLVRGLSIKEIQWHNSRSDELVPVRPNGWRAHPWLIEDRPVLGIGSVEPHYFAGFTGVHKTLTIGCASYEDVESNHANTLLPGCCPGRLAGNPVFEGILQMLEDLAVSQRLAGVNLVQVGSTIIAAAGGIPLEVLEALTSTAQDVFIQQIDVPADAIIVEAAGPLGQSLYQADKAIMNNQWAVRNGGVIILVAPCENGIGQDHFVKLLIKAPTAAAAKDIVSRRGYRLGDHKAIGMRMLTDPNCRAVKVFAVSKGLSQADTVALGITKATSVDQALSAAGIDPNRHRVYRIMNAGNLCVLAKIDAHGISSRN